MTPPRDDLPPMHDLTDPARNCIFNMSLAEARDRVRSGDAETVRGIEGNFAIAVQDGIAVRMARSLGLPMRFFIAKREAGPALVVAERIGDIARWLHRHGYADQFHPSYTRMVPAHHLTEVRLVGCPDPSPAYRSFLQPPSHVPTGADDDVAGHGRRYVTAIMLAVTRWLERLPDGAPVGVCFSGGLDSGAVLLVVHRAMRQLGKQLGRLKAFTLRVDGRSPDADQAAEFLRGLGLQVFHEIIDVAADALDPAEAVRVIEDYKPLDVQAAAMTLALVRGIRARYGDWRYLVDGDGGDENLKSYPIEENPELTIRSVLNNPLLYHEGWGVGAIKHSLTYSGGLSRGIVRGYAPLRELGFVGFSPCALPSVVSASLQIPFAMLCGGKLERLYALKGELLRAGVEGVCGVTMPVFTKRRFQEGAWSRDALLQRFPLDETPYRRALEAAFHDRAAAHHG